MTRDECIGYLLKERDQILSEADRLESKFYVPGKGITPNVKRLTTRLYHNSALIDSLIRHFPKDS